MDPVKLLQEARAAREATAKRGDELLKLGQTRDLTEPETTELEGVSSKLAEHDTAIADLQAKVDALSGSGSGGGAPVAMQQQNNAAPAGQQATVQAEAHRSRYVTAMTSFAQARMARAPAGAGLNSPHAVRDLGDRQVRTRITRALCNYGMGAVIDPEDRTAAQSAGFTMRNGDLSVRLFPSSEAPKNLRHLERLAGERRDQSVGTANEGGDWVAREFMYELEKYLLFYCDLRQHSRVIRTATGADLDWPKVNDTAVKGRRVAEKAAFTGPTNVGGISKDPIKAYKYTSDTVIATVEFIQDIFFDFVPWLFEQIMERIGRIQADEFTTADGSSKPQGVVVGAGAGPTAQYADKVTLDDCLKLKHNVDLAYRKKAKYMMHDDTLLMLTQQKDAMGKYLLQDPKDPTQFVMWGLEVAINNSMATAATTARSVLCGDFSRHIIRDALDVTITRQDELYSNNGEVGFVGISRADSRVINSTAIKALVHP